MAKFKRIVELEEGYSEWLQPTMSHYKMACCDCGLVHDMQFKVVRVIQDKGNGYLEVKSTRAGTFAVHFRAKRNNRSTGQMRRKKCDGSN